MTPDQSTTGPQGAPSPRPPAAAGQATGPADAELGVIRVRIRDLRQLYDSLDPSPFVERDLDDKLAEYVESCASEIPRHLPLRLVVHLTEPLLPASQHPLVQESVRNHFDHQARIIRLRFRRMMRIGRRALLIGLAVLSLCFVLSEELQSLERPIFQVLGEGLIIGGWVAMWRPMELLLYDWWPVRRELKDCERLRDMSVEILVERPAGT